MERQKTRWEIATDRVPSSVEEVVEVLLARRGLERGELSRGLEDLDGHAEGMRGLHDAAALVARALRDGRRTVLIGDYDCDGLTSVAQLARFLRRAGDREVAAVTPSSRAAGYGVPLAAVRAHADAGLFVALDCGTHDREAVAAARGQGAEVVVIDHHAIPDAAAIAPATALVNPRHPACPSTFKDFATAGLTWVFLSSLRRALGPAAPPPEDDEVALAAIGTVADVMPLLGPNRILVRHGLEAIARGRPAPVQALREVAGVAGRRPDATQIAFQIAPRLNAAARMEDAGLALRLLLSEDPAETLQLARQLEGLNRRRQEQVEAIFQQVRRRLDAMDDRRTVVIADPGYPLGVNGILAQRVVREVHRPTVVLQAFPDDGLATGSARSIPGFDLFGSLGECADLLERWGGHAMAAGLTVRLERLERFGERWEAVAQARDPEIFRPVERADLELPLSLVTRELLDALRPLEPHGMGNPAPKFALRGCTVAALRTFGRGASRQHVEIGLQGGPGAIVWGGAPWSGPDVGEGIELVGALDWDDYRGEPRIVVRDHAARLFAPAGENLAAQGFEPRTRGL